MRNNKASCLAKKYFFLCLLVLGGLQLSFSQNDSLLNSLKTARADTSKVNTLLLLSKQLIITGDYDPAMHYALEAKKLAEDFGFKTGQSIAFTYMGLIYYNWGNAAEALKNYYASLKIREEKADKKGIAATYHNIANVYYQLNSRTEARKFYEMSVKIKRELNDTLDAHYAHTINNLGNFYQEEGDYKNALVKYNTALEIELLVGDLAGVISTYNGMANIYMDRHEYDKAEEIYFKCLKIEQDLEDKEGIAALYNSLGNLYYKRKEYAKSLTYLNKGKELAVQINSKEDIRLSYGYLADLEYAKGNFRTAYDDYRIYIAYSDTMKSEENIKKSVQEQMVYEFSKKEALAALEKEKKDMEYKEKSRQQKIITYSITGGLLLVIFFSFFLYNRIRVISKQKEIIEKQKEEVEIQRQLANERMLVAEKQTHIIEEKQKEILDSIRYAQRIQSALITSEKYIERNLEKLKNS
ncbi:MAG: protein serine/threonine phosphatase [Bacteroidetes bacterium]|nr:protein serine/threonine phosphatase [Bacteroidota bacterium]